MDAGCEGAPWVRSANPSDSWAVVMYVRVVHAVVYWQTTRPVLLWLTCLRGPSMNLTQWRCTTRRSWTWNRIRPRASRSYSSSFSRIRFHLKRFRIFSCCMWNMRWVEYYSSKNSVFPWSGRQKVLRKLFVSSKNARFCLMCRHLNLHELAREFDARNLCKKLVHVSCTSFLTVCHHHYDRRKRSV